MGREALGTCGCCGAEPTMKHVQSFVLNKTLKLVNWKKHVLLNNV